MPAVANFTPASAGRLVWDIDRANDLESALADTRKLVSALRRRYGTWAEDGLGVYFSGSKGFHISLVAPHNAVEPRPLVPTVMKRLCVAMAQNAGIQVDAAIYDVQRFFRLPNSRLFCLWRQFSKPLLHPFHGANSDIRRHGQNQKAYPRYPMMRSQLNHAA